MKTKALLFLLAAIVAFAGPADAQRFSFAGIPFKKGEKEFSGKDYFKAITHFEKSLAKGHREAEANYFIGECYRLMYKPKQSLPFYEKAIELGHTEEEVYVHYAEALKANEQYDQAELELDNYITAATDTRVIDMANISMQNLRQLEELEAIESHWVVKNLDGVNTEHIEYGALVRDGTMYFVSSRGDKAVFAGSGDTFTDLYQAQSKGAKVEASSVKKMGGLYSELGINEGSIAISPDGNTIIFAKGNNGKRKGAKNINLFISKKNRRGEWTDPELLRGVTDAEYWDSTPVFARDGRTIYFASTRRGGKGGADIYRASVDRRGRWGNVTNMRQINTEGDELFPYVSPDGKLYFSSNGHATFGGLDLFVMERHDGKNEIRNLGKPLNSSDDDFGIYFFKPDRGFFSSNREGGKGSDDIYTFKNDDPELKIVNYLLEGITVTTTESGREEVLPSTIVQLIGADSTILDQVVSDPQGRFSFRVYENEDYTLHAESDGYFTTRSYFTTVGKSVDKSKMTESELTKTFQTKINLDRIVVDAPIVLENIYYDLGKAEIRTDAAIELDKLVLLLEDNPDIRIELSAHTDVRADHDFNMALSQRRADSAVTYIVNQGIDKRRIVAKGYGETQLIVKDAQTEEEHERNRRTEFKVIGFDLTLRNQKRQQEEETIDQDAQPEDRYFNETGGGGD